MSWRDELKSKAPFVPMIPVGGVLAVISIILAGTGEIEAGGGFFLVLLGFGLLFVGIFGLIKVNQYNSEIEEKYAKEIKKEREEALRKEREEQVKMTVQTQKPVVVNTNPQNSSLSSFADGTVGNLLYEIDGLVTTILQVYEDRCILIAKTNALSFVAGKFFNGTKEFFYDDLTNVQFREATKAVNGYLQFDYPGAMNVSTSGGVFGNNHSSENSFVFSSNTANPESTFASDKELEETNALVSSIYRYIHGKIREAKAEKKSGGMVVQQLSAADEIKKYQDLLVAGAITQEEFDTKKKQLLGL